MLQAVTGFFCYVARALVLSAAPRLVSTLGLLLLTCGFQILAQEPGQQIFGSRCAGCHGLDGRGGEHAPNIATEPKVQVLSDRDLSHIVREGRSAAGMPGFGSLLDASQLHTLIEYLRVLQNKTKIVPVTGDAEHGRVLFFGAARCSTCHMVNGQGGFLGADLSSYGSTHTPDTAREAIIDPNKDLDPRRGTVLVVTRAGARYTGIVRNEDNFSLQMQTADGNFHFFDKSALEHIERRSKSLMPSDYESRLGSKNVNDLVAYLVKASGSQPVTPQSNDQDE